MAAEAKTVSKVSLDQPNQVVLIRNAKTYSAARRVLTCGLKPSLRGRRVTRNCNRDQTCAGVGMSRGGSTLSKCSNARRICCCNSSLIVHLVATEAVLALPALREEAEREHS